MNEQTDEDARPVGQRRRPRSRWGWGIDARLTECFVRNGGRMSGLLHSPTKARPATRNQATHTSTAGASAVLDFPTAAFVPFLGVLSYQGMSWLADSSIAEATLLRSHKQNKRKQANRRPYTPLRNESRTSAWLWCNRLGKATITKPKLWVMWYAVRRHLDRAVLRCERTAVLSGKKLKCSQTDRGQPEITANLLGYCERPGNTPHRRSKVIYSPSWMRIGRGGFRSCEARGCIRKALEAKSIVHIDNVGCLK